MGVSRWPIPCLSKTTRVKLISSIYQQITQSRCAQDYSISLCTRLLNLVAQDYSILLCTKLLNLAVHKITQSRCAQDYSIYLLNVVVHKLKQAGLNKQDMDG